MKTENELNELFRLAREQKTVVSLDEMETQFINEIKTVQSTKSGFKLKSWYLNSVLIASGLGLGLYFLLPSKIEHKKIAVNTIKHKILNKSKSKNNQELEPIKSFELKKKINQTNHKTAEMINEHQPLTNVEVKVQNKELQSNKLEEKILSKSEELNEDPVFVKLQKSHVVEDYEFPILTEKEKKENAARKRKMVKNLMNLDQDEYEYIPSTQVRFHGEDVSLQSYLIQRKEVSNIQYKTFLFDLLIQNRKEDFLKAKPNQHAWVEILGASFQHMEDNYFSDDKYDNFPVNNVSAEGIQLYCNWLTEQVNKSEKNENIKFPAKIRIPTRVEWEKAMLDPSKKTFPSYFNTILDSIKGTYKANVNIIHKVTEPNNKKYFPIAYSKKKQTFDAPTFPVNSTYFERNQYGIFHAIGNVAECVQEVEIIPSKYGSRVQIKKNPDNSYDMGTAGGGWIDSPDETAYQAKDKHTHFKNAHPNVGFRVAFSYVNSRITEQFVRAEKMEKRYKALISNQAMEPFSKEEVTRNDELKLELINNILNWKSNDLFKRLVSNQVYQLNEKNAFLGEFVVSKSEVSLKEYFIFLNDLMHQNRLEEFKMAYPDSQAWQKILDENFTQIAENYLKSYEKFPIVNIPRAGAELYCTWLFEELKKQKKHKNVSRFEQIRLPNRAELTEAFHPIISTKIDYFTTEKGSYKVNFNLANYPFEIPFPWNTIKKGVLMPVATKIYVDFPLMPVNEKEFVNSFYGLHHSIGNVAEMVYEVFEGKDENGKNCVVMEDSEGKKQHGTFGGGWMDSYEEILNFNADKYAGIVTPHPNIGFRIVFVYREDWIIEVK